MRTNVLALMGILIIAFMVLAAPVMAADTGTATITGNPPKKISLTLTGSITDWNLNPDASPVVNSTAVTMEVKSNSPGWVVAAKDGLYDSKPAGSEGKMVDYATGSSTYGTEALASALQVGGGTNTGYTGATVTLSGSDQTIETGASGATGRGTFSGIPLTFTQAVAYTDPVQGTGHVYRIVVTFTGTTP